jgi:uncharacterized protein (DUF302 family)
MALLTKKSPYGVRTTIDRAVAALERRNINVFARVDHGAGARAVDLELAAEQLVIFGDPRAGTLLMQRDPAVGYELPLRLLAWDAAGQTLIGYRRPTEVGKDYELDDQAGLLERMDGLLEELVSEIVGTASADASTSE